MAGPWEDYASAESGPWADYSPPKRKPNAAKDVAKSGLTGVAAGAANLLRMGELATPMGMAKNTLNMLGVQTPMSAGQASQNAIAQYGHKPETRAGRYAESIGENVVNALAPGGPIARVASVVLPGMMGEGAREAAESAGMGETGQGIAKAAGGIAGGLGASVRGVPRLLSRQAVPLPRQNANELAARAAEYRAAGIEPTLIDVGDDTLRGVVRAGASRMTPGRQRATDFQDARVQNLPDRIATQAARISPERRSVPEMQQRVEARIQAASTPPGARLGSAGSNVSTRLNREFDAARGRVDEAYSAAREAAPEQAMLPRERVPQMAANIREAVRDFDPMNVPRVSRELGTLDNLSTGSMRDLFDLRSRLTNLRVSPDAVEATAAGRALRALDEEINAAADQIVGDPEIVSLWRNAIAERRAMGQRFQGDDLIQQLTERERRGGAMTNAVAPEDASNAMFGSRTGVGNRANTTRDLTRLRDQMGPDSQEWRSVQQEALTRVLQRDGGSEDYGAALERFSRENPDLAELLFSPEQRRMVAQAQQQLTAAVADRSAIETGSQFLAPGRGDEFAANAARWTPEQRAMAQAAARRNVEVRAGENVGAAPGLARRIANAPEQQARNVALIGPERANELQNAMRLEERAVRNANDIAPRFGSQTQNKQQDAAGIASAVAQRGGQVMRGDPIGAAWGVGMDWLKSRGMNDQQAEALVNMALDPAQTDRAIQIIAQRFGPQAAQQAINWRNAALLGASAATAASAPSASQ